MKKMRLKGIIFDCDFRKNEATNYKTYRRSRSFPGELKTNEVFLFVSKSGNQLIWLLNVDDVEVPRANRSGSFERKIYDSRRWRIDGGVWNPDMLQNYAHAVGIDLVGFRRLEQTFAEHRAA